MIGREIDVISLQGTHCSIFVVVQYISRNCTNLNSGYSYSLHSEHIVFTMYFVLICSLTFFSYKHTSIFWTRSIFSESLISFYLRSLCWRKERKQKALLGSPVCPEHGLCQKDKAIATEELVLYCLREHIFSFILS